MIEIVFDRKNGHIGIRRSASKAEEKTLGTNYVVDILDPVDLDTKNETVKGSSDSRYDWHKLHKTDARVKFIKLFDVIEGGEADWYYDGHHDGEGIAVEEALIENRHEVFELIRKIFG